MKDKVLNMLEAMDFIGITDSRIIHKAIRDGEISAGDALWILKTLYSNKIIIPNEVVKECIKIGRLKREFQKLNTKEWYFFLNQKKTGILDNLFILV